MYCPRCGKLTNIYKDETPIRYDTKTGKPIFWYTRKCPNWNVEYEKQWLGSKVVDWPVHLNYSFKDIEREVVVEENK